METFKIIIVDDDSDDQELLLNGLEANNLFKVIGCAGSYKQLLALMQKLANDPPDLILLDLNIPGKGGVEICAELKACPQYNNTSFVLMSEIEPLPVIEKSMHTCSEAFFTKPCTIEEFKEFAQHLHSIVQQKKKPVQTGSLLQLVSLLLAV